MEMGPGKLFIGGISWDTDEDRLKEYFQCFGEVVEAVIMKDRATGRARGFGFVVFADPAVAERVVQEKHLIDGRNVEAKKAVPRDDQNILNRNNSSIVGPQTLARTKKIFVGGLASTVTENHFKKYFEQFGTITDVVVMYDQNTQRPRGFGFITYDSEEAVERVLHKTFHELNGKMVEVKRAVPKEMSPGPSRNQYGGYSYSPSRVSNLLDGYAMAYNQGLAGGFGVRMDGRLGPANVGRSEFPPISPGYGANPSLEAGLSPSYGGNVNLSSTRVYGRGWNPFYSGNTMIGSPLGYDGFGGRNKSILSPGGPSLWGDGSLSYNSHSANPGILPGSVGSKTGIGMGTFDSSETIWGSSTNSRPGGAANPTYNLGSLGYGSGNSLFGFGRNRESIIEPPSSYFTSRAGYNTAFEDFPYTGVDDPNLHSSSSKIVGPGSFDFGLGSSTSDFMTKTANGHVDDYSFADRQTNRGIAA